MSFIIFREMPNLSANILSLSFSSLLKFPQLHMLPLLMVSYSYFLSPLEKKIKIHSIYCSLLITEGNQNNMQ